MHDSYPIRGKKVTVTIVSNVNSVSSINAVDKSKQYRQSQTISHTRTKVVSSILTFIIARLSSQM